MAGLSSPAQLLAELERKQGSTVGEPPLQDLMDSVQRRQSGAATAPPPAADRLEVFPEPAFVVKTANEQGQKVFINVCGSSKMPLPPGWAGRGAAAVPAQVEAWLAGAREGDPPPSMRFPMSMGAARFDHDHRGAACLVLDCILSSQLLEACAAFRPLKLFLIELALGLAAQQTGLELDPQYRLPKMRYKGEAGPPPQFIRTAPGAGGDGTDQAGGGGGGKQLVAEVADGEGGEEDAPAFALLASKRQQRQQSMAAPAAKKQQAGAAAADARRGGGTGGHAAAATATAGTPSTALAGKAPAAAPAAVAAEAVAADPRHQLHAQVEYEGKPATAVCITVPLPPAAAATARQHPRSVQVSVCAERVAVALPGCRPLEAQLPFAVSATGGSAELHHGQPGSGDSLVLRLPYLPVASLLQGLRQAAPAAEGGVDGSSSGLMELD